jgi:predicted transglutaminase-like cysteine proteinase
MFRKRHLFLLTGLLTASLLIPASVLADKSITDFSDELLKRVEEKYGKDAVVRLQDLADLVKQQARGSEMDKVKYVNDFFNKITYYNDIDHWHKKDYWATPFEKLTTNGGDCEDYAIGKYFTLRELGVKDNKLRMMYVKAIKWNEAHMVLTYFPEQDEIPLVLDNINKTILPANQRKDLVPVYSFNGDGLWLAKERGTGKRVGDSSKIGLWSDLNNRINQ